MKAASPQPRMIEIMGSALVAGTAPISQTAQPAKPICKKPIRPAAVPTSYVRMALQTDSAVAVIACIGLPEENYRVECSDLIYMEPDDDPVREIEKNAEKVLREAEKFIRAYPSQWAMFYPVWPFALEEMP